MTERIERMLARMSEYGFTHALVQKPQNMRYLTGYTGEGSLLISAKGAVILTDFRYVEQAGRQAPEAKVVQYGSGMKPYELIRDLLREEQAAVLAIEEDHLTMKAGIALQETLEGVELKDLQGIPESLRIVKNEDELDRIRKAAAIACRAFDHMLGFIRPGMTEREIQLELDYTMLRMGSEGIAFSTIACAGENGSLPHAIPSDRPVKKGELLTMDFGAQFEGYKSDMTRTIAIGKVSDELDKLYHTVLEAQKRALDMIGPGVRCCDVDKAARDYIDAGYPGAFGHSLGHGVGLNIHEQPGLNARDERELVPGHVVTIEPGIYIPGLGGCRIEDMGAITSDGFDNFITAPKHLIEI
ncbi:MAG: aminopeptidase P family protein [Clostridia bacterium]|nr:aminopeptidase P family protein [Clostridia bacterium]